jgi:hypothetical protein
MFCKVALLTLSIQNPFRILGLPFSSVPIDFIQNVPSPVAMSVLYGTMLLNVITGKIYSCIGFFFSKIPFVIGNQHGYFSFFWIWNITNAPSLVPLPSWTWYGVEWVWLIPAWLFYLKLHIILVYFLYSYATNKAAGNLKIEIVPRRCEIHIYWFFFANIQKMLYAYI